MSDRILVVLRAGGMSVDIFLTSAEALKLGGLLDLAAAANGESLGQMDLTFGVHCRVRTFGPTEVPPR